MTLLNPDPACGLCGGRLRAPHYRIRTRRWSYLQCRNCGSCRLDPMPTEVELETYYNGEYQVNESNHLAGMQRVAPALLDRLEQLTPGRRLFEVGCSYGGFLTVARARGWNASGLELAAIAAAAARKRGFQVVSDLLAESMDQLEVGGFDAVCMWHVVEHIPDAAGVLCDIRRLLRPQGVLMLRTPNATALGARLLGPAWEWAIVPAHVGLYSPSGVRRLVQDSGFEEIGMTSQRGDARTLVGQGACAALRIWRYCRQRGSPPERESGGAEAKRALHAIRDEIEVLGRPVDRILGLDGGTLRGSELVVWARKGGGSPAVMR